MVTASAIGEKCSNIIAILAPPPPCETAGGLGLYDICLVIWGTSWLCELKGAICSLHPVNFGEEST